MANAGKQFPDRIWSKLCESCGKRFRYRSPRKGRRTNCPVCAERFGWIGQQRKLLVAADARIGEGLEEYLDRKDREAWNMGEAE